MLSIDENARKEFEAAWLKGESRSLKEFLPPDSTETYIGTLEELVCIDLEFRWQQSRGQNSNSEVTVSVDEAVVPTRIEDYVREFPELEQPDILQRLIEQEIYVRLNAGYVVEPGEYQSRFPTLKIDQSLFSGAGPDQTRGDQERAQSQHDDEFPRTLGQYELTGLLGRGGMGSVYRATQKAAGRDVALKIADVSSLNAQAREMVCKRFEKEAHAAAGISHDHVVPIFDVGVIDGCPYYAMQLVDGGDLGSKSKAEPLPPKQAAEYLLGICRGIAQAHAQGVLHRDIKPQNMVIDSTTGRAMMADFGLARFTDDASGMTQAGQVLGTPSFMPPEQIKDSSSIDERADVYSLGGSLYQLLTGRPPFKASDVHETLRQVIAMEPVAPRTLNPAVDLDLDTICLKCLEKEPDARYQTADELAADLENFLGGRPTVARPAGPFKRVAKWCGRNKALATALSAAMVGMLAAITATATGLVVTSRKNRELTEKTELVSETSLIAVEGLSKTMSRIADEPLFNTPGIEPIRAQVLKRSVDVFQQLANLYTDDASLQLERAFAMASIGNLSLELNLPDEEALEYLTSALTVIESLPETLKQNPTLLEAESDACIGLGKIAHRSGDSDTALEYFRRAEKLREQWLQGSSDSVEAARKLANAKMNTALALAAEGKIDEAERLSIAAQDSRMTLLEQGGSKQKVERDIAQGDFNLAFLELRKQGGPGFDFNALLQRLEASTDRFGELARKVSIDARLWEKYVESRLRLSDFVVNDSPSSQARATSILHDTLNDIPALIQINLSQSAYRSRLFDHYQYGIEALISMSRFKTETTLGNLALAEDHLAAFDGLLKNAAEFDAANEADSLSPTEALARSAASNRLRLISKKLHAFLSVALNDEMEQQIEYLQSAISEFDSDPGLVAADPLLSDALQRMQQMLAALNKASE